MLRHNAHFQDRPDMFTFLDNYNKSNYLEEVPKKALSSLEGKIPKLDKIMIEQENTELQIP